MLCCSDEAAETDDLACHTGDDNIVSTDSGAKDGLTVDKSTEPAVDSATADSQTDALRSDDAVVKDSESSTKQTWCFADIKKQWRRFNIDLMPKVILVMPCCLLGCFLNTWARRCV